MPISEFADTDVVTAAPDTPIDAVTGAMRTQGVEVVVVLDEERPVGLLTAADIGRAYVAGDLADRPAVEIAADPPRIPATADLSRLVAEFADAGERRAIVVDADGAFAGVVTLDDALAQYGRDLERVLDLLD
jgi:CBS domain-containing protein